MKFIELIVVLNILIHFCFVKVAYYIMKLSLNKITTLISCVLDGIYVVLYILIPYEIESYKYIMIFIISLIPFITKGISKALMLCIIYLMLNFTLGGSAGILYKIISNPWAVVICIAIILLLFAIYAFYTKFHFRPDLLEYDILIEDAGKKLYLSGFCDTGNFLTSEDNVPIVFINKNIKIGTFYRLIKVNSISSESMIAIYKVKSFKIKIKDKYIKKEVYLAYGDIAFSVMFGTCLLGGK